MAKRWYMSPVIGDGTMESPYRAKLADTGVNHVAVIPSHADGSPRFNWCLVKVAAAAFTDLDADSDLDGWPLVSLDTQVRNIPVAQRQRIAAFLERRGIDTSDVQGTTTLRTILRRVGRILDENFHEDRNDVRDV